jgi:hypothetical protein
LIITVDGAAAVEAGVGAAGAVDLTGVVAAGAAAGLAAVVAGAGVVAAGFAGAAADLAGGGTTFLAGGGGVVVVVDCACALTQKKIDATLKSVTKPAFVKTEVDLIPFGSFLITARSPR